MNKKITWILGNGFLSAALYFGFYGGMESALSAVTAIVIISFGISIFVVNDENIMRKMIKTGRSVPPAVDIIFDLGVVVVLAINDHWILSFLYLFHTALLAEFWRKAEELKNG